MNNTIMIVDDMQLNIELLADILDEKYIIMPATSGETAIRLLERKKPDLVLLDVSMPGIDGFDVLRFMKERKELVNIPVIFVTGEHDTGAEEKGLALGAVDYVKKPYSPAIISVKVQNHLELKAYRDDLELLVQKRTKQLNASRDAIIMGMSLMSESHDKVTGEHIERIKKISNILTDKMLEVCPDMITPETAAQIVRFSPLHDIGKIAISDTILKKTGVLTSEEFDIMKTHTLEGAKLLKKITEFFAEKDGNDLKIAIEIAEYHHEKYDGTGYPHALRGDEIPVAARVVAIADVYDALRSSRPYKKAFSHEEALVIITQGDGRTDCKHFDPRILAVFVAVEGQFKNMVYE